MLAVPGLRPGANSDAPSPEPVVEPLPIPAPGELVVAPEVDDVFPDDPAEPPDWARAAVEVASPIAANIERTRNFM